MTTDQIKLTERQGLNETGKEKGDESAAVEVENEVGLKKTIGLLNGVTIIVGCMIGSGIFISPSGVLLKSQSYGSALIIWFLCGVYTTIGAYCYAELGCLIKRSSGDYAYVYAAFGPLAGFLRMWIDVIVTRPCSTTIMALTFAQYALEPFYYGCSPPMLAKQLVATGCILIITFINCWSVKVATKVQDIFTCAKLLALVILIGTGIAKLAMGNTTNWAAPFEGTNTNVGDLTMAFYTGLFAYTGWSFLNCMIEEMSNPVRDLPRAIFISCGLVTVVYVLTNVAYFTILSKVEILNSNAVAVGIAYETYGFMWWIIPIFVAMSTFGSVNGNLLTTARIFIVAAQVNQMPKCLSMVNTSLLTPIPSVLFGMFASLFYLMFPDIFVLIRYVGIVTWLTFGMAISALLYFRITMKNAERPIKVHLLYPIVFLLVTTFLIVFAFVGAPLESLIGTGMMLSGIPVYWLCVSWKKKPSSFNNFLDAVTIAVQKLFLVVQLKTEEDAI